MQSPVRILKALVQKYVTQLAHKTKGSCSSHLTTASAFGSWAVATKVAALAWQATSQVAGFSISDDLARPGLRLRLSLKRPQLVIEAR